MLEKLIDEAINEKADSASEKKSPAEIRYNNDSLFNHWYLKSPGVLNLLVF